MNALWSITQGRTEMVQGGLLPPLHIAIGLVANSEQLVYYGMHVQENHITSTSVSTRNSTMFIPPELVVQRYSSTAILRL